MKLSLCAPFLCLIALQSQAADIGVVGLFPGKAVLIIDGASPKTYSVGTTVASGIKLVDVNATSATFDEKGRKERIEIGEHAGPMAHSGPASVTLQADGRGHFVAQGQINGGSVRMLVDTGASMISMSTSEAMRLGIDYTKGQPASVSTANGIVPAYRVMLDSVKVGDITLNQVEALVQGNGLTFTLLGMSFLNRMEMQRNGDEMVLTKRY